ncbi:hypothetical protein VTK73DRAFT_8396 [Phialemonium thermophilum]|uniref:Uncharacterized protein n=1 Tax=Phialemonium thermophilum TaxID=223376 RepID=A0ABR3W953_9PEZI
MATHHGGRAREATHWFATSHFWCLGCRACTQKGDTRCTSHRRFGERKGPGGGGGGFLPDGPPFPWTRRTSKSEQSTGFSFACHSPLRVFLFLGCPPSVSIDWIHDSRWMFRAMGQDRLADHDGTLGSYCESQSAHQLRREKRQAISIQRGPKIQRCRGDVPV